MNIIPKTISNIKAYWCSWSTQNFLGGESLKGLSEDEKKKILLDGEGAKLARSMLNERNIFGKNGLAYQFTKDIRKDLYFMLDDGWDVDYDIHPDKNQDAFASLIVSSMRFKSVNGKSPQERLKTLNDMFKKVGWKGIGIWVCSQQTGKDFNKPFSKENEEYWIERIKWSKYAKVEYWKVDWGTYQEDVIFRNTLTRLRETYYPELIIEHAICVPPLNGYEGFIEPTGRFIDMKNAYDKTKKTIEFAQVFRSYDVLSELAIPTTIDRVSNELDSSKGFINGEDELYIDAVLGMQMGIMRSYKMKNKMDEAVASIKFQRISPPFIGGVLNKSVEILEDNYTYLLNETWFGKASNRNVFQKAPAIVSRNTKLPNVKENEKPYVLASLFKNNTFAIGTFKRVSDRTSYYPLVNIECYPGKIENISIFGKYKNIIFKTNEKPIKVYCQSLLDSKCKNITKDIKIIDDGFIINGKISELFWKSKDGSDPAITLKIKY